MICKFFKKLFKTHSIQSTNNISLNNSLDPYYIIDDDLLNTEKYNHIYNISPNIPISPKNIFNEIILTKLETLSLQEINPILYPIIIFHQKTHTYYGLNRIINSQEVKSTLLYNNLYYNATNTVYMFNTYKLWTQLYHYEH